MPDEKTGIVCEKCKYENPSGASYCLNCGRKLVVSEERGFVGFEGLCLLHLTGSAYLIVSILFSWTIAQAMYYGLVKSELSADIIFLVPYLVAGILGLVASYEFNNWRQVKRRRLVIALAVAAIAVGFGATFSLFYLATFSSYYLGRDVSGVIGPAWIIFLINGWKLWTDRNKLKTSS